MKGVAMFTPVILNWLLIVIFALWVKSRKVEESSQVYLVYKKPDNDERR